MMGDLMQSDFTWPSDQLEALHACHMVEDMFNQHVCDASFVTDNADLFEKAEAVHRAIADMYQAIGRANDQEDRG